MGPTDRCYAHTLLLQRRSPSRLLRRLMQNSCLRRRTSLPGESQASSAHDLPLAAIPAFYRLEPASLHSTRAGLPEMGLHHIKVILLADWVLPTQSENAPRSVSRPAR